MIFEPVPEHTLVVPEIAAVGNVFTVTFTGLISWQLPLVVTLI